MKKRTEKIDNDPNFRMYDPEINEGRRSKGISQKILEKITLKRVIIFLAAAALLVLSVLQGKLWIEDRLSPYTIDFSRFIQDTFEYNGDIYVLGGCTLEFPHTEYTLIKKADDQEKNTVMNWKSSKWVDEINRFLYTKGKRVYTCDVNGKNKEFLCKIREGDYVAIDAVIGQYAILRARTFKPSTGVGTLRVIDLTNGNLFETDISVGNGNLHSMPLAVHDGYLYYRCSSIISTSTLADYDSIRRCELSTGNVSVINEEAGIDITLPGCVIDGYLYCFIKNTNTLSRLPIEGGELEKLDTDPDTGVSMSIQILFKYENELYAAGFSRGKDDMYSTFHICRVDWDENCLSSVYSLECTWEHSYNTYRFDGNTLVVGDSSYGNPIIVKLEEVL